VPSDFTYSIKNLLENTVIGSDSVTGRNIDICNNTSCS
jgi:hypothetical protein